VTVRAAPKRLDGYPFSATGIIHGTEIIYKKRQMANRHIYYCILFYCIL